MSRYVSKHLATREDKKKNAIATHHSRRSNHEKTKKSKINAESVALSMHKKENDDKFDEITADVEAEKINLHIDVKNNAVGCEKKTVGYVPKADFGNELVFDEQEKVEAETANNRIKELYLYAQTVLEAIVSAFLILTFFLSVSVVIGSSMEPTLKENDRLVIMKFFYKPSYGDIIAVWAKGLPNRDTGETGEMIVKRVIGLEGDVIDIDEETGTVYRNGIPLEEDYIKESINSANLGNAVYPLTVAENSVFVLGDNRNHSTDSRYVESTSTDYYVGCIDLRYIMGKAVFRIYPVDRIGVL